MTITTTLFDPAKYLTTPESQAYLLQDAIEEGNPAYLADVLGIIARARGMTQVARDAGVTREALYKALSPEGDPKLSTLFGVVKALGLKMTLTPVDAKPPVDAKIPVDTKP